MNQPLAALASPDPRHTTAQLRHTKFVFGTFLAHPNLSSTHFSAHRRFHQTQQCVRPIATNRNSLTFCFSDALASPIFRLYSLCPALTFDRPKVS
jgi:hypothetical protein